MLHESHKLLLLLEDLLLSLKLILTSLKLCEVGSGLRACRA